MGSPTTPGEPLLTIGQVAERAGLNTSHIRFYERVGVLPEPERVAGQRRYRDDVLHRLSIIDVAQRAGLTLEEITPLTGPGNRTAEASSHIRSLADEKLPHIEALIARAEAVKNWLHGGRWSPSLSPSSAGSRSLARVIAPASPYAGCSSTRRCCRRPARSSSTCGRS